MTRKELNNIFLEVKQKFNLRLNMRIRKKKKMFCFQNLARKRSILKITKIGKQIFLHFIIKKNNNAIEKKIVILIL